MLEGWLARGLDPRKLAVLEPHPTKAIQALARQGVAINPRKKNFEASAIVIAVKPQNAPEAMPALGPFVGLGVVIVVARRRDAGAGSAPESRRSPESSAVEPVETT